jgi:DNA (cytosine-5)-methyltransferase 1
MKIYYNEIEPFAVEYLKILMTYGELPYGFIDDRHIQLINPVELLEYDQCHFFAGMGGWAYALSLTEYKEVKSLWTGSCPCQPFSTAGKQKGKSDDRHLWPHWFKLIKECRPQLVFGEQVASAIKFGWLDTVYDDLERENYTVRATVLPASSIGKPHRRERLWFVGNTEHPGFSTSKVTGSEGQAIPDHKEGQDITSEPAGAGSASYVADTFDEGLQGYGKPIKLTHEERREGEERHSSEISFLLCPDGKYRLVEYNFYLLVDGLSVRLADVYSRINWEAKKEVEKYASANKIPTTEVLRMVQQNYDSEKVQWETTGCGSIYPSEILQSFVFSLSPAQYSSSIKSSLTKTGGEDSAGVLRSVSIHQIFSSTSCGYESYEQLYGEPSNSLHALSLFLACCAEAIEFARRNSYGKNISLLQKGQPGGVGMLKCLGNAIVPQVAAEFIKASFEEIKNIKY